MCGFGAFIQYPILSVSFQDIILSNSTITHRGPDDEGYLIFNIDKTPFVGYGGDTPEDVIKNRFCYSPHDSILECPFNDFQVAFCHRRLSIVDLTPSGHQPMSTGDGRFWIVYNGEVYNHLELREELEKDGIIFYSGSDTEVILNCYARWGPDCLSHLNGMFAFIILDTQTRTVFAARDRFGVKPLYYWFSGNGLLAFASEIKVFQNLPGWDPVLNEERAYDFLVHDLLDHTGDTLFHEVKQVPAGHACYFPLESVRTCNKSLPLYRWYSLPPNDVAPRDFDWTTHMFYQLFRDAVKLRLRSDVPIGSCLSGGLDSTSVVCVARSIFNEYGEKAVQKTYSAGSEDPGLDEIKYVDEVIKEHSFDSHVVYPGMDLLWERLDDVIWHQDEPFRSTSIIAQWSVFRMAHDTRMKVMLDGQGADETLCGYPHFFGVRYGELFRSLHLASLLHEVLQGDVPGYSRSRALVDFMYHALPDSWGIFLRRYMDGDTLYPSWINFNSRSYIDGNPGLLSAPHSVDEHARKQLLVNSLPMLLHWEDRNSMAHSIESRLPFLDYHVVELVIGAPGEFRISRGQTKRILRSAMKGVIPEVIRERRDKIGFVTAEIRWMQENPAIFRNALKEAVRDSQGFLNEGIIDYFDDFLLQKKKDSGVIWRCICFGRWMRRFRVSRVRQSPSEK